MNLTMTIPSLISSYSSMKKSLKGVIDAQKSLEANSLVAILSKKAEKAATDELVVSEEKDGLQKILATLKTYAYATANTVAAGAVRTLAGAIEFLTGPLGIALSIMGMIASIGFSA